MGIDHPAVQSTLVPTCVTVFVWIVIRFVFRAPRAAPVAVLVALGVVFVLVNGLVQWPILAVDKMALAIALVGLLSLWVTYGSWGQQTGQWVLLAGLIICVVALTVPGSPVLVAGLVMGYAVIATGHWNAMRRDDTGRLACWLASLITTLGLAVLMLNNGSASTFQLLLALAVSWVSVVLCERGFRHHWALQAGTLSAPLLLIGGYALRYAEIGAISMAALGLALLVPSFSRLCTDSRTGRLAAVIVSALLLATVANFAGEWFDNSDDPYY